MLTAEPACAFIAKVLRHYSNGEQTRVLPVNYQMLSQIISTNL